MLKHTFIFFFDPMLKKSTTILVMASVLVLSSCTTVAPTPAQEGNGNTNIVDITNVNENSVTVIENTNSIIGDTRSAKKMPLSTDRSAPEGCTWKEDIFSQIRFLQHDCPGESLTFTERGTEIYSSESASYPVIELFTKNTGETPENAVLRVALAGVTNTGECEIVKSRSQRIGADRYEVAVSESVQAAYQAANPDAPWWEAGNCGEYAQTNGVQYFEFQPEHNNFFFIRVGQDTPGIDVDGIELGMNN